MKVRLGDLEACRANPRAWAKAKATGSGFMRPGYERLAVMAIYHFHKTADTQRALEYFVQAAARRKLVNSSRLDLYEEKILSYAQWVKDQEPIVAARKINIRIPLTAQSYAAGEVSRLDIDLESGGYRAVLLTDKSVDVRTELRMPLIQLGIASAFGRDPGEVAVGTQSVDGLALNLWSFSKEDVVAAVAEARALAAEVDMVGGP